MAGKAIVIKARVPIIKCHLSMGVAADISLGAVNGAVAVQYIQAQVGVGGANGDIDFLGMVGGGGGGARALEPQEQAAPLLSHPPTHPPTPQTLALAPLRPLALVVKAVLKEAGLNEVFSGGLSSYCTTLMVMAHLLAAGPDAASPATADCGALLWSFFQLYGREFDYATGAVRVQAGGFGPKLADWFKPDRPAALAVEDPQEAGKDIGSGSFNIDAVRDLFSRAADALAAAGAPARGARPAPSPLQTWATVQIDGASTSVPPAPVSSLSTIMDVDAALGRRRQAASAPRPVGRRAAGAGDRGRGPPRPALGHPHHVAPAGPAAKAPARRRGVRAGGGLPPPPPQRARGKFARERAAKAADRAPPTSVHRPMGASPAWMDGGGGGGGGRRGGGSSKKWRKVEWG